MYHLTIFGIHVSDNIMLRAIVCLLNSVCDVGTIFLFPSSFTLEFILHIILWKKFILLHHSLAKSYAPQKFFCYATAASFLFSRPLCVAAAKSIFVKEAVPLVWSQSCEQFWSILEAFLQCSKLFVNRFEVVSFFCKNCHSGPYSITDTKLSFWSYYFFILRMTFFIAFRPSR